MAPADPFEPRRQAVSHLPDLLGQARELILARAAPQADCLVIPDDAPTAAHVALSDLAWNSRPSQNG
jgi:hypothetical protein